MTQLEAFRVLPRPVRAECLELTGGLRAGAEYEWMTGPRRRRPGDPEGKTPAGGIRQGDSS